MAGRDIHGVISRAQAALTRGQAAEVVRLLGRELQAAGLRRDQELAVRCTLAEAWLIQGDLKQANLLVGRVADAPHEPGSAGLAALWRLQGCVAAAQGEQSRAVALLNRALLQAERAHDAREIGLANYELALCYRRIGDTATVREHLAKASAALHAAGDRRHLALAHSLSGITLAEAGRYEAAMAALRQAERIAALAEADDVVAVICGNQASVAVMQHRHEQALALAERSVQMHERAGSARGLGVALATLGQICVKLGDLDRAESVLHRALEARRSLRERRETAGAVYDTLAQLHLIRGRYDQAGEYLRQARDAYGEYGAQASHWYEWSVLVLEAKVALRRGAIEEALARADHIVGTPGVPPGDAIQAHLIAAEARVGAGRHADAQARLELAASQLQPTETPGLWGEHLRIRGEIGAAAGRLVEAHHDLAQSISIFELIGDRYQAGLSHLALAKLAARGGARPRAESALGSAARIFESLGASAKLQEVLDMAASLAVPAGDELAARLREGADVLVRRLVEASALPELLGREAVASVLEGCAADASVLFAVPAAGDEPRVISHAGVDKDGARRLARRAADGKGAPARDLMVEPVGRIEQDRRRMAAVSSTGFSDASVQRFRMMAAVVRQGFELCAARERPMQPAETEAGTPLEALMPGFICNSTAMRRVVDQIQRLQGSNLTVLITGESGTGKELVARAIHLGSRRSSAMFLPYNCTTATRELADSQLFGHRRGSFTGAVADQPGLIRSAAGGTLFLDEIGDLPLDVQPKLLRFLEHNEILPVGDSRPQYVDVRVLAATNADLEQRVAEGRFREDLFYRLSVIRIHVPPLRDRREEIPHLSTFFLRETCEQLGKPDVQLSPEVLDLFAHYAWPGNVRQLRNEIQRAVALSPPDGLVRTEHLSADLVGAASGYPAAATTAAAAATLGAAVEQLERELIRSALTRSAGNISETARTLGLTRRGLYLKLRRLGLEGPRA